MCAQRVYLEIAAIIKFTFLVRVHTNIKNKCNEDFSDTELLGKNISVKHLSNTPVLFEALQTMLLR